MKNTTRCVAKLSPIALMIFASVSQAASPDTIVVTGSRSETAIADVASTMWVVDQEKLERALNSGADLKNALGELIPGFDFGSNARTNYSQNLRGRSALVMIDGVSLNSTRNISRQLDSIDPFNIARVEVLSGATSIYGAGAAGGIINIITKKATGNELTVETKVGGQTGFNDSNDLNKNVAVALSGGTDTLRGRASVAYSKNGGAYDSHGEMIRPDITQTDLQFNETIDVMGNVEFTPDDHQKLSVTAQYYNSEQDSDYATYLGPNLTGITDPSVVETRKGLQLDKQPNTERVMLNAQYSHDDVLGQQLLAQAYFRTESLRYFPYPSTGRIGGVPIPLYGASEQKSTVYGLNLALIKRWEQVKLTYGMDASRDSFEADQTIFDANQALASGGLVFDPVDTVSRYPDIDSNYYALFSQVDWEVMPDWSVSGGFRYAIMEHEISDHVGVEAQYAYDAGLLPNQPEAITGGDIDYDEWLFNLGSVYHLTDNMQVWGNFSQGFDVPDPARFFGQGTYQLDGSLSGSTSVDNASLQGVKTNSYELGWRMSQGAWDVQVAGYLSLSDKTVSYDRTTFAVGVEDDDKRIYGIEGQTVYQINDDFYTGVQAHYVKSETKVDGSWEKLEAASASPSSGSAWFGFDNYQYGAELRVNSFISYEDEDGEKLESFTLANLSAYYALPVGRLNVGIQNLFDRDYETIWSQRAQMLYGASSSPEIYSHNGLGRTLAVSYSATF
ncbi:TonB-dependent receptor [Vibrio sp. H11]|uniref:TonB-dependent receptor n=1 Tax=Vibrio sp. H11 TaxID=2565928 RepID=UPI0010A6A501|nr:TonB-dependent receptor [Vibrio sp. H11]